MFFKSNCNSKIIKGDLKKKVLVCANMRRAKANLMKSAIHSYLRRRRYSEPELNIKQEHPLYLYSLHQMAVMGTIDKEVTRNNSISFSNNVTSDSRQVEHQFTRLKNWIADLKGDSFRYELEAILCPLFCHLYLEMLCGNHRQSASKFFERHQALFSSRENSRKLLEELACVSSSQDIKVNTFIKSFRSAKYHLQLSPESVTMLQRYLSEHGHLLILQTLQKWFDLEYVKFFKAEKEEEKGLGRSFKYLVKDEPSCVHKSRGDKKDETLNHVIDKVHKWFDGELKNHIKIEKENPRRLKRKIKQLSKGLEFPNLKVKEGSIEPKVEPKFEVKVEPKVELQVETKVEPKVEPMVETKIEVKMETKVEPKIESKVEPAVLPTFYTYYNIRRAAVPFVRRPKPWRYNDFKPKVLDAIRVVNEKPSSNPLLLYIISNVNRNTRLSCASVNGAGSLLGAGVNNFVKVWGLSSKSKYHRKFSSFNLRTPIPHSSERKPQWQEKSPVILYGHSAPVQDIAFVPLSTSPEVLVSVSQDTTMRSWRLDTNESVATYRGHNHEVWCVDVSSLGLYVATGSRDRTARIWTLDRNFPLRTCAGHHLDVECIKFHPNNLYFATGSADKTVKMWSVNDAKLLRLFFGHTDAVQAIAFSPNGKFLASAADDKIKIWDLAGGKLLKEYEGHTGSVVSLSWDKTNEYLSSASADGTVRLWTVKGKGDKSKNQSPYLLRTYPIGNGVLSVQYSRSNTLVSVSVQ